MPQFRVGDPVATDEPAVVVDVDPNAPLPPGRYTFQLVVVDDSGLESSPSTVDVIVRDDRKPTAVIKAPSQVPIGKSFQLDGRQSSDPSPGRIVQYRWTLVDRR